MLGDDFADSDASPIRPAALERAGSDESAPNFATGGHFLERRVGVRFLARRRALEERGRVFARAQKWTEFENWPGGRRLIRALFGAVGLHERARRNARSVELREHRLEVRNLPPAFRGFRILHLSDLHIDIAPDMPEVLARAVRGVAHDACVLTGDFRAETGGDFERTIRGLATLFAELPGPVYAVFGNHDSLLMLEPMERLGARVLVNEHVRLEREGQSLYLAGIDDPHFYRLHDLEAARRGIPDASATILLAHSPEVYEAAEQAGFGALLCGHTHGGQLCLPGGTPFRGRRLCPSDLLSGSWRHGGMSGYTSVGCGTCVVDLRLNCRPEITLHRLSG